MFTDRRDAGRRLAQALNSYAERDPVVLALPRGGLPVAREVARVLHAPIDVVNVRKLGAPTNPEFAFGAVGENGAVILDEPTIAALGISDQVRDRLITEAASEIERRVDAFRAGRDLTDVAGRTVIIVDDGLATGATAAAAVGIARATDSSPITSTAVAWELCCSICSPRTRDGGVRTSSTSTCSPIESATPAPTWPAIRDSRVWI